LTNDSAAEPAPALTIGPQNALCAATRTALIGLAETVPWNSLLDYDVAVELLDALHDPYDVPAAGPPPAATRQCLYDRARSGLDALTRYRLDSDVTWAADPHHTGPAAGGER
jgi:hypothetical protein